MSPVKKIDWLGNFIVRPCEPPYISVSGADLRILRGGGGGGSGPEFFKGGGLGSRSVGIFIC